MIKNKLLSYRDSKSLTVVFSLKTTENYYVTKFESKYSRSPVTLTFKGNETVRVSGEFELSR